MKLFFDFDGTLVDNRVKYHRLYVDLLRGLPGPRLSLEEYWELKRWRVGERDILKRTGHEAALTAYLARRLASIESPACLAYDRPFDGVLVLLESLHRKHEVYLVTARNKRKNLLLQLDNLKMRHLFKEVLSKDDNAGTAEVKCELIGAEVRGCESNCVIVGDTELDVTAGKQLGIETVAVESGIRAPKLLRAANPEYLLPGVVALDSAFPTLFRSKAPEITQGA